MAGPAHERAPGCAGDPLSRFEVIRRDGLARISHLSVEGRDIVLPSAGEADTLFPGLAGSSLENVPLDADPGFAARYLPAGETLPVRVHPAVDRDVGSGTCVMVPCWHTALADPRKYVEWLVRLKERLPPDTAFYAPAAAVPSNISLLCYTGFDLFDFTAVDLASARGEFCLPEGVFPADLMEEGACSCPGCREGDLFRHNRAALLRELALVRMHIASSSLRDLVESRSRMDSRYVSIIRFLDRESHFLEPRIPVSRPGTFLATSGESLFRTEVRRFADRVVNRYIPPAADVAVLLPCSAKKPYFLSQSHRRFMEAVSGRALELIVTSPLGLVPRDLERVYPAAHYDVPVTGYWDAEEKAWIAGVIAQFFRKHRFRRVIAHLEGGALDAAGMAAEMASIDLECTTGGDRATSRAALNALSGALSGEKPVTHDLVRATASYQFDTAVDTKGFTLKERFPDLKVFRGMEPLFSLDPGTGLLRPTFGGWELIPAGYRVEIDAFVPSGDILAPGVVGADPRIREGDEVLVTGPLAVATGRAAMPGPEMVRSRRGVAVKVRKVKTPGGKHV